MKVSCARGPSSGAFVISLVIAGCTGAVGGKATPGATTGAAGTPGGAGGASGTGSGGAPGMGGAMVLPLVPGRAPLRRLSRVEYNNTVRDLLGDTTQPAQQFEPDTLADGFTNNADTQNVGTNLAQQYLGAAEALSLNATKNLTGLMGCDPATAGDACVRMFVTRFGQRAWRRPLAAAEVDALDAVYTKGRVDFDVPTSVQMILQTFLTSPKFLYRVEHTGGAAPGTTVAPLTSWEIASRLSYFLIGSMPDDALFTAAAADQLATPDQIAAQARRLLSGTSGPVTDRIAQFFTEWLHLVNVASLQKDMKAFPTFTATLGPAMLQETQSFVTHTIFGGPGDLGTLLTAPYTYATPEIAALYGTAAPAADGKLMLDPKQRAGLLTQPALMATFAKADSTDPVHRGKFIFEDLLCGSVPPPPSNVNITPPVITPNTTARQRFAQHDSVAACAACHIFMDPIGLAFENYDGMGRWRDTEGGQAIDVSGKLTGTDVDGPFVGAVQLAQKLASSAQVSACAVRELFRFGFGRFETAEDAPTLSQLASGFGADRQKVVDLMVAMTQVPAFLKLEVTQ
ncbi:MAG TPA: DUF1592 domain-containing protein [Polyangia bacterium]